MTRDKNQSKEPGFTLIEVLVVVAIIALLSSIALIAFQSAQQKGRNVRRLGDMTQMNTALELYFNTNKGYPSSVNGQPLDLKTQFSAIIPTAPGPADGLCDSLMNNAPEILANNGGQPIAANTYFYIAEGPGFMGANNVMVYPSYSYYFCLGGQTGNFSGGPHILTNSGVK